MIILRTWYCKYPQVGPRQRKKETRLPVPMYYSVFRVREKMWGRHLFASPLLTFFIGLILSFTVLSYPVQCLHPIVYLVTPLLRRYL